ncbi:MAG: rod shape-determining protein MreC [Brevinema sp.]
MLRFFIRFKIAVTALFLLIFCLFTMSSKINTEQFYFRTFLFSALYNVERLVVGTIESIQNVFTNVRRIQDLEARLESAEQRLLHYRELTFLYDEVQNENQKLRGQLGIRSRLQYPAHYSKIIFRDPTFLADYIIIDKGTRDGIRLNMPVVYSSESNDRLILVGKIIELTESVSKVRLVSARNLYLGVKLENQAYTGVLKGQGSWNQNLSLEYIPFNADIRLGDSVVTSGESEIYPPGLRVGSIQGIGQNVIEDFFKTLYVKPAFDYKKMSDVFILEYTNEMDVSNLMDGFYER